MSVGYDRELLTIQDLVPPVGSAIGLLVEDGTSGWGTLGGYVKVDGKTYGLTCHHTFFTKRLEAFPNAQETDGVLQVAQPPGSELLWNLDQWSHKLEALDAEEAASDATGYTITSHMAQKNVLSRSIMNLWIRSLGKIQIAGIKIGHVHKTSGIRVRGATRMDWALVEFNNSRRVPNESTLINQVGDSAYACSNAGLIMNSYKALIIPRWTPLDTSEQQARCKETTI